MTDDNVINLHVVETGEGFELPAADCLQAAIDHGMDTVVICGWDKDGGMYLASNTSDGQTLLTLEQMRHLMVAASMGMIE